MPPALPIVNVKLAYAPIEEVTKATGYLKCVPEVYKDNFHFNYSDEDYEITVKDCGWLKNTSFDMQGLTEK